MAAGWIRDEPPIAERFQLPLVIAIAVAGGAVGFGITAIDGFGPAAFNETGKFHLWLFLICVQTALWALGAAVFLLLLRTPPLADVAKDARPTAWLATAAVAFRCWVSWLPRPSATTSTIRSPATRRR
jgi:hypothetical protein